jgi:hypothetical protein
MPVLLVNTKECRPLPPLQVHDTVSVLPGWLASMYEQWASQFSILVN